MWTAAAPHLQRFFGGAARAFGPPDQSEKHAAGERRRLPLSDLFRAELRRRRPRQRFVEDCPVCCRPIAFEVGFDAEGDPVVFSAEAD
jgi:hypothetical protein